MTNISEIYEQSIENYDDEPTLPPKDIFTTNEIRSCAELCRMVVENSLNTQPAYQRRIVWTNAEKTRFIDSLSKRLPIPSLCISVSNEKYEVIDGQQRISTIVEFLSQDDTNPDSDWRLSNLNDIDINLRGKKISEIKQQSPELYSRIRNTMLPVTSVYCDYSSKDHLEYIYKIFHRLNTTGASLNNQEIRNCVFFGPFNNLIKELDQQQNWKKLLPSIAGHDRLKGQERILMFFAFFDSIDKYNGKLTKFLNDYMIQTRNLEECELIKKKELFDATVDIAKKIKFSKSSKVLVDAVLYGIATNIENLKNLELHQIEEKYNRLMQELEFFSTSLSEGIWQKDSALKRLLKSKEVFAC